LNRNKDADKLSAGLAKFVVEGWFVIKLEGCVFCCREKWRKKKKFKGGEGCSSSNKLHIKDVFKSVSNSICKNDMSLYFLTCFHSLFSHCNSLGIYLENIFISIYRWILRVHIQLEKFIAIYRYNIFCLCVFVNFLVV